MIVDTDAGLDDLRGLGLLLADSAARVRAVLTSDGVLSPAQGVQAVRRLLLDLGRTGVRTAPGPALNLSPPPWREFALRMADRALPAAAAELTGGEDAARLLDRLVDSERAPQRILALGPLTNIAALLDRRPDAAERIAEVWFVGDHPHGGRPSWNAARDPVAAARVFTAGIPMTTIVVGPELAVFDEELLDAIPQGARALGGFLQRLYGHPEARHHLRHRGGFAYDDLAALLLLNPALAEFAESARFPHVRTLVRYDRERARASFLERSGRG